MKSFPGVVKQILPARVPVMSVWEFLDMRVLQRREYVRIADKVPVRFRKEERFNMFGPWSVGVTKDISGGGLQIVGKHSGDIAAEDFVEIELSLADGKPAQAIARVVRISSWGAGASNFAVQFVQIHPADRRQIVQYVMSRQSASIETDRRKKS
jgi:c-di-GMP-binding flagellar brake protein YcgR